MYTAPLQLSTRASLILGSLSFVSLVVEEEILVAAVHVTTQNLGGKDICRVEGVAQYLNCCCDNLCGLQTLV